MQLKIRPKYNLNVSQAIFFKFILGPRFIFILKNKCSVLFRHWTVVRLRLFLDIGHVMPKIDWEGMCTLSRRKLKRACTLLELKNITMYERVNSATAVSVTDTYFELKMLCLFYFVLKSENTGIILHEK